VCDTLPYENFGCIYPRISFTSRIHFKTGNKQETHFKAGNTGKQEFKPGKQGNILQSRKYRKTGIQNRKARKYTSKQELHTSKQEKANQKTFLLLTSISFRKMLILFSGYRRNCTDVITKFIS